MVRTVSAALQRSFAQITEAGAPFRTSSRRTPSAFVTAALLQSVLLAALALAIAMEASDRWADTARFVGALALMTSVFVGYSAICGNQTTDKTRHRRLDGSHSNVEAAAVDFEQLAKLKARVSHELRTPLNAVIGFSDMMHREVLGPVGNERYREYAAHIRISAERFQIATENTLAVTELLTTARKRQPARTDLRDAVCQSLADFQKTTCSVEPQWKIAMENGIAVECDQAWLADALQHIWTAGRSLALSDDGRGWAARCEVSARRADDGRVALRFAIGHRNGGALATDCELAPGAELSIFLARWSIQAAGGELQLDRSEADTWQAVVLLPGTRHAA